MPTPRTALTCLALLLPIGLLGCGATTPTEVDTTIASITVTFDGQALTALGASVQLSAEARNSSGDIVPGAQLTWASSDASVVSVSTSGLATAVGDGVATITAAAAGVEGTASITVTQTANAVIIVTAITTLTALEQTEQLSARLVDANGNALPDMVAMWSSSDPTVVAILEGARMRAEANGTATISATIAGISGTAEITVAQVATTVTLTPAGDTLRSVSDTVRLATDIRDAGGSVVAGAVGSWNSSAPGVATVSTSGLVSPVADGVTTVTFSVDGISASASILVSFDQISSSLVIDLNTPTLFAEGGFVGTATVRNGDGVELTGLTVQWTSPDANLSVQNVQIDGLGRSTALVYTGAATGTFTIHAETASGIMGSATVTVVAAPAAQGVSIDFETVPSGALITTITCCAISTQFSGWGITFRWRDAFAGGGSGFPTLTGWTSPGSRSLTNDQSSRGSLTGSHEMTFSVDIARFQMQIWYPTAAVTPPIRAFDQFGQEIAGVVVDLVRTDLGGTFREEIVVHSPILIRSIKVGPSNGILWMDNLVY